MKWAIFVAVCIITIQNANSQRRLFIGGIEGGYTINIASDDIDRSFTPIPDLNQLKSVSEQKSDIEVTFINFPQDAKNAFLYAISVWENILSSPVPIHVLASWDTLSNSIVSKSRPSLNFRTFEGARVADVYYPVALVEKLSGEEVNPGEPDIICSFNKNMPWYFGTDGNTPANSYDFVTSVLHEVAHGLGFYGFLKDNNETGFFNNANNLPSIYDYYIFNELNQQISDKTIFNSPSFELHQQLTSSKLKLYKSREIARNQETLDWIYAPEEWKEGSSIYHFKESTNNNQLMSVETKKGRAIHYPGNMVIKVLSELGWESVSFVFNKIKDFETPCEKLPVHIKTNSDVQLNNSSFKLIFSTNNFTSCDTIQFAYNSNENEFYGEFLLNSYQGVVQYYFEVNSTDGRIFRFPSTAPDKKLDFRIGPDYYPPEIHHNPKRFIMKNTSGLELTSLVTDNIGIENVKIEFRVNGSVNEIQLNKNRDEDYFSGEIPFHSGELSNGGTIEYRLVARDKSLLKNKSVKPTAGYYQVEVFKTDEPVEAYQNSFNTTTNDFLLSDFSISKSVGFNNGNLHTVSPYQISDVDNEYFNHYAILKHPVVLKKGGLMKFDEIVLVEPGEAGTDYNNPYFWDYVIVEGSKDGGRNWLPLTNGYDSDICEEWDLEFQTSIINNTSVASGLDEMYHKKTINILENSDFEEGDTVIFRFRLASDKSVNGWGWAIDNLEIQETYTGSEEITASEDITIYPNPFKSLIQIDFNEATKYSGEDSEIRIIDLVGKTVYNETLSEQSYINLKQLDLSKLQKGIYLVNITNGRSENFIQKIVKN